MKILFLLFPLILLLVQGAEGNAVLCRRIRGFCSWRSCPRGTSLVGRCSPSLVCCRSPQGFIQALQRNHQSHQRLKTSQYMASTGDMIQSLWMKP
ncbi:antimicrobial peptide THP1-like [Ammospiza nelsoni]|uniref:antimicrobial peptide THP1-like n=1 Tax=Ammospiza nelsoni TaxID=2857394 RepID=UPI00286C3724|nr:antimicrobial peptide THP1-like [Ammospiza nelsoni]XP_059325257.1 antimicrobial peptide THP1-like [Ammospiza nelsoni]